VGSNIYKSEHSHYEQETYRNMDGTQKAMCTGRETRNAMLEHGKGNRNKNKEQELELRLTRDGNIEVYIGDTRVQVWN